LKLNFINKKQFKKTKETPLKRSLGKLKKVSSFLGVTNNLEHLGSANFTNSSHGSLFLPSLFALHFTQYINFPSPPSRLEVLRAGSLSP
jgi:hypothetical protein